MSSRVEQQVPRPPRVSIIVNAFNGEEFIRDALDSVLAQSYTDWEVVLWDDRSTDRTREIVASYGDERIRYFLAPSHTPLGEARHLATGQAKGEWLAFLDQDDVWTAAKLEQQIGLIDEEVSDELGLVYGRARWFTARGPGHDFDHRHEFGALPEGNIFDELLSVGCFVVISSAMVRASAYRAVGGIPPEFPVAADYYLFVAIAEEYRARAVDEICCWYRAHDASMTRSRAVRLEAHRERMQIVQRWKDKVPPEVSARVHRVHNTLIALEEAVGEGRIARGLERLIRNGSPGYLLSRPLARSWRALRRILTRRKRRSCEVPASVRGSGRYA